MTLPESFAINHTVLEAPQIRLAKKLTGPHGDIVSKFDVRLLRPNTDAIPPDGMHTLEHCLATYIHEYIQDVIDISPMGCRTGFYLSCIGEPPAAEIEMAIRSSLERVQSLREGEVPGVSERECGNWREHSLAVAKEYARKILREWQV